RTSCACSRRSGRRTSRSGARRRTTSGRASGCTPNEAPRASTLPSGCSPATTGSTWRRPNAPWRPFEPTDQPLGGPGARLALLPVGGRRPERGAAAVPVLDPCGAAVQLGEPRDERETDPGSRGWVIAATLLERLEDALALLRLDARPIVLDEDQDALGSGLDA